MSNGELRSHLVLRTVVLYIYGGDLDFKRALMLRPPPRFLLSVTISGMGVGILRVKSV